MPPELELGLSCERWGALPSAGGLLDQDIGLMMRMSAVVNVYRAIRSEKERGKQTLVEWSDRNPQTWKVLAQVERIRRSKNGE